jgi:cytochrome b561
MSLRSTSQGYGTIAVAIHWLSVLLILALIATGFRAANTPDPSVKIMLLKTHMPIAILVLILTLVRAIWWIFADRKPAPARGSPLWQERLARAVHVLFYVAIFGAAASGIGMIVLSGAGAVAFGQGGVLPDFWNYPPRVPHAAGARLIVALLLLHTLAALYHHFFLRDGLLRRMWFSR